MKTPDLPEPLAEVDALLRETLRDDLPEDVEARLERRLEVFLVSRHRPAHSRSVFGFLWDRLTTVPEGGRRALVGVPAAALLACGIVWHGAAGPPALAESLAQAHLTVSIADAVRGASSMSCTGDLMERFRSPADFANHLYLSWVLLESTRRQDGALHVRFVDPGEAATYELVVRPETMRPSEIRRITRSGSGVPWPAAPADCTWVVPTTVSGRAFQGVAP
jgi:hypothetical protein